MAERGCVTLVGVLVGALAAGCTAGVGDASTALGARPELTPSAAGTTSASAPRTAARPSSARPSMAGSLHVSSTRWIKTPAGPSLEIDPGPLPRSPASTEQARVAWVGVVRSLPAADGPGMWEQFLCHAQFAAGKRLWHLEPWRPARSYPATVAALCNPGPEPDPDRLPRKGVRRARTRGASSSGARSEDR